MFKCDYLGFESSQNIDLDFFQIGAQSDLTMLKDHDDIQISERSNLYFFGQAGWIKQSLNSQHGQVQGEEVLHAANKIFLRGDAPYLPLSVDDKIKKMLDIQDSKILKNEWVKMCKDSNFFKSCVYATLLKVLPDFYPAQNLKFRSKHEKKFYLEICPKLLHPKASHFIFREISIGSLLGQGFNQEKSKGLHVDFVFFNPINQKKYVIEIDSAVDGKKKGPYMKQRKHDLEKAGFQVINVFNHDIEAGEGGSVDEAISKLEWSDPPSISDNQFKLIKSWLFSGLVARGAFAIVNSILQKKLSLNDGFFKINPKGDLSKLAFGYAQNLIKKIFQLHGKEKVPFKLKEDKSGVSFVCSSEHSPWSLSDDSLENFIHVGLSLIPWRESNDFVKPANKIFFKKPDDTEESKRKQSLEFFLNLIFRYEKFRKNQIEGINLILSGEDSLVLLPTSAGKSLIYQLCSILTPGVSICIFPLKALIDDQRRSLYSFGIDKVTSIHSRITQKTDSKSDDLLKSFFNYYHFFCFVSPERFRMDGFREPISKSDQVFNYSIVDESHCVSEWGHDFRFPYFHLEKNLRKYTNYAPIIGLTGTSSPQVVSDMQSILDLSLEDGKNIIRPLSAKRPELEMNIRECKSSVEKKEQLKEIFKELKEKYKDQWPCSGLVFFPKVNSRKVDLDVGDLSASNLYYDNSFWKDVGVDRGKVGIYTGKPPSRYLKEYENLKYLETIEQWEDHKYETFKAFHRNEKKIIICTKAFGMGIDKSDIRFTIHFSMSSSLESFYQESGRAGRDREKSSCYVLFNKGEQEAWDKYMKLSSKSSSDYSKLRSLVSDEEKKTRQNKADIATLFWFHKNSWKGENKEIQFNRLAYRDFLENSKKNNSSQVKEKFYQSEINIKTPFRPAETILKNVYEMAFGKKLKIEKKEAEALAERYIQKLAILGMLKDHSFKYANPKYWQLELEKITPEKQREHLKSFFRKLGVGFLEGLEETLKQKWKKAESDEEKTYILFNSLVSLVYENIERKRRSAIITAFKTVDRYKNDAEGFAEKIYSYLGSSKEQLILELSTDSSISRNQILSRMHWWIDEDGDSENRYQSEKTRQEFLHASHMLRDENSEESLFHFLFNMTNILTKNKDLNFDIFEDAGLLMLTRWDTARLGDFESFLMDFLKPKDFNHEFKIRKSFLWKIVFLGILLKDRGRNLLLEWVSETSGNDVMKKCLVYNVFNIKENADHIQDFFEDLKLKEIQKELKVI